MFAYGGGGDEDDDDDAEDTCIGSIRNTLGTMFDHAVPYSAPVASYGEDWGYVIAFDGAPTAAAAATAPGNSSTCPRT